MPPVAPCEGCCVKMVQFIGTDHYQVKDLKQKFHQRFEEKNVLRCFMIFLRADK